jgi:hypothetical protein
MAKRKGKSASVEDSDYDNSDEEFFSPARHCDSEDTVKGYNSDESSEIDALEESSKVSSNGKKNLN